MSFSEYLWKDVAASILSVVVSNWANDSLDSLKIPRMSKAHCSPFVYDWTTQNPTPLCDEPSFAYTVVVVSSFIIPWTIGFKAIAS